jgi:hypothetical protein
VDPEEDGESNGIIGGLLESIINAITGGISDIIGFLTGKLADLYSAIVSIVDYLNPMSESFILKIAFIPEEGYFQGKIEELSLKAGDSVGLFSQLKDTFSAIVDAVNDQDEWEGIRVQMSSYGVGGIGDITIVDPSFINYASYKLKYWISGFIWFMLLLWLIKRVAGFWGRGEA